MNPLRVLSVVPQSVSSVGTPLDRAAATGRPRNRARWAAGAVLLVGLVVLGLALYVQPDVAGLGTHRQLGLPPCSMIVLTGYPCPTCGMTTAFAHFVRGQGLAALRAQPGGAVLALVTLISVLLAARTLVTGRPPNLPAWLARWELPPLIVAGLIVLGWAVKMAMLACTQDVGV